MTIKLYDKNNDPRSLAQVVSVLADGGIIAFPTGTTYALGCHALKERAVERICKLRQVNPKEHPLSIICYDMSTVSRYAEVSTATYKLIRRNAPGPFTFVLPGLRKLPPILRSRKDREIGIRMPDSPIVRSILELLDAPMMTASLPLVDGDTSYQLNPELVAETFAEKVDLVVDGGEGRLAESTIVDCTADEPAIVRQGEGILA